MGQAGITLMLPPRGAVPPQRGRAVAPAASGATLGFNSVGSSLPRSSSRPLSKRRQRLLELAAPSRSSSKPKRRQVLNLKDSPRRRRLLELEGG